MRRVLMISLTITFVFLVIYVGIRLAGKSGTDQDVKVRNYFLEKNTIQFTNVMSKITKLANVETIFIIGLPIVFYLIFEKRYVALTSLLIGALGSILFSHGMKLIFRRIRPSKLASINHFGYSYPSGHAATGMGFYVTITYLVFNPYGILPLALILAVCLGLLIAVSRIVLGVHWLSDVVIGVGIGLIFAYWATVAYHANFYLPFF